MGLTFEWDPQKAKENRKKHGVSFDEAATVFGDTLSVSICDTTHSVDENRFIIIGQSAKQNFLLVVYTEQEDKIRIISARPPTRRERKIYEEGEK
jgi:uncharacterized DUF497 family protein